MLAARKQQLVFNGWDEEDEFSGDDENQNHHPLEENSDAVMARALQHQEAAVVAGELGLDEELYGLA